MARRVLGIRDSLPINGVKPRPSGVCYETRGEKLEKAMFGNSGHRFLLFPSDLDSSAQLASQGLLKLDCAENIQHAF
jgi:hypothetical protein